MNLTLSRFLITLCCQCLWLLTIRLSRGHFWTGWIIWKVNFGLCHEPRCFLTLSGEFAYLILSSGRWVSTKTELTLLIFNHHIFVSSDSVLHDSSFVLTSLAGLHGFLKTTLGACWSIWNVNMIFQCTNMYIYCKTMKEIACLKWSYRQCMSCKLILKSFLSVIWINRIWERIRLTCPIVLDCIRLFRCTW